MASHHRIVYAFIAFEDIRLLERKIKFLYTREDYFIVHWNKYSSRKKFKKLKEIFKDYPNIYIYSKIKVVWGYYTILLAMLENMNLALRQAREFEHLIMLSEQCAPVKTKEYIKNHLAKYRGKSFCGSDHLIPEVSLAGTPCASEAFSITCYFVSTQWFRFRLGDRLRLFFYLVVDCLCYLVPILKNSKETFKKMSRRLCQELRDCSVPKKIYRTLRFMIRSPGIFMYLALHRGGAISLYGKPSKLYSYCSSGTFQMTKAPGPCGCYCYEDIKFLCRKEYIKLAKKMKRYNAPEEYFCETLLYNNSTQRKNFLNENLCAADYLIRDVQDIARYLDEEKFTDVLEPACTPRNYQFQHICFVRKVLEPAMYDEIESYLLKTSFERQP